MSHQSIKKTYRTPRLLEFGRGSLAEESIKRWVAKQGLPASKIERVLRTFRRNVIGAEGRSRAAEKEVQ